MTARPTHAAQAQQVEDALAAMPGPRWGWLFTPDPKWLAAVNTTTLREVNAVRMFVLVTLLWNGLASVVTGFALGRCYMMPATLVGTETMATVRQLCEESLATHRMLDFAAGLFDSYGILLAAMASVAAGAMWVKRATDTEHRVRVEEAKKAPVLLAGPVTAEHPAPPAPVSQTVTVNGDALAAKREQGGDSRDDDERAD